MIPRMECWADERVQVEIMSSTLDTFRLQVFDARGIALIVDNLKPEQIKLSQYLKESGAT